MSELTDSLISTNLLLSVEDELARDVLHGLHAVLRAANAELCLNRQMWSVVLLLENRAQAGKFRVAAIVHRIGDSETKYEVGWFGKDAVMAGTMARPTDYAQVRDVVHSMADVLTRYGVAMATVTNRKGMVLSQGTREIALIHNITRFGAEIQNGRWRFDTVAPVFEHSVQQDAALMAAELDKIRGGR